MTATTPLRAADLYHSGIVVDDFDGAAARLTAATGCSWTRPLEYTVAVRIWDAGGETVDVDMPFRVAFTVGAPNLELVAAVPGTVWTETPGRAVHHLGYWVDDIAAAAAGLRRAGYTLEAAPADDTLHTFGYFIDPAGVRIEIVDRALFPDWPGFLAQLSTS